MNNEKSMLCRVAGHLFEVSHSLDDAFFDECMSSYAPFAVECSAQDDADFLFSLKVEYCEKIPEYTEELRQDEDGQQIICGTIQEKSVFDFRLGGSQTGVLVCSKDYKTASLQVPSGVAAKYANFALNNALMVLYAIASAPYDTALFHAAVVNYKGVGYMFLGKSGTGKSTHARLWLKYIEGSSLLNDDNPVVRIERGSDGRCRARVYGSPWSGKTPCYKNEDCPLGGFVFLSQAPFNKIERLRGVQAYAALVPCISGKRWESAVADGLHETENALAMNVPVWYLECLPDEAAARLCLEHVASVSQPIKKKDDAQVLAEAIRLVAEGIEVIFPVNGNSMRPFIEGGSESVLLVRPEGIKPMDIVLARVERDRYVVHRVLSIEGERVTLMGDGNLAGREYCECKDIYAKVTHIVRKDGRKRALDTSFMIFLQEMWLVFLPIRRYLLKLYRIHLCIRKI